MSNKSFITTLSIFLILTGIQSAQASMCDKTSPNFVVEGDLYYEIKEGEKTRTQFFKGVGIQRKGSGTTETFTIRKMSGTVGVERIFPVNMPALQKVEVNKKGKVRRARIYYFRGLTGKKARIKEVRM